MEEGLVAAVAESLQVKEVDCGRARSAGALRRARPSRIPAQPKSS